MSSLVSGHISQELLSDLSFPAERLVRGIQVLNSQLTMTGFGQMCDIVSEIADDFTETDAMRILEWKTARYTFELPLQLGAVLAGASDGDLGKLEGYAIPAGIAFQLQDDILGLYGDEQKLGKPVGSDVQEGKHTLLVIKALEKGTAGQRERLMSLLGKSDITMTELDDVREIVKQTGSYTYTLALAQDHAKRARIALGPLSSCNPEALSFLASIVSYMVDREV